MKTTGIIFISSFLLLLSSALYAQVGIGTDTPAASAALEVSSSTNNKGILIPRMTAEQKDAISNPAEGLMIYQTSAPSGFYYFTNGAWKLIISQTDLNLKVDKASGKDLSSNDYSTAEKTKLAAITGTNTGDQDLSALATAASVALKADAADLTNGLATKVDQVSGKDLSSNDYSTAEKTKLAAITGTNSGDQDLSSLATATNLTNGLATKVDKVSGKDLSTNDYTSAEKTKLAAITGTNSGDQDLSSLATATNLTNGLATKVDKVSGKDLSTNDYTTIEKTKLAAITGTNTGDQINITGNAATATLAVNANALATLRNINGVAFDGTADVIVTAGAGTLTGSSLNATVTGSSLTSVGTLSNLAVTNPISGNITGNAATVTTNANLTGDVTSVGNAATVVKINGTALSGLTTGILKNTTTTGVPSIALAGTDYQAPITLTTTGTGAATLSGTTLNIPTPAAGPTLTLGQAYQGGAIIYLEPSGQHGLVVSPIISGNYHAKVPSTITGGGATGAIYDGIYAGKLNTKILLRKQGSLDPANAGLYAANVAASYSVTEGGVIYNDWYFPSIYEVALILENNSILPSGFKITSYGWLWSSTEYMSTSVSASDMYAIHTDPSNTLIVKPLGHADPQRGIRLVRAF